MTSIALLLSMIVYYQQEQRRSQIGQGRFGKPQHILGASLSGRISLRQEFVVMIALRFVRPHTQDQAHQAKREQDNGGTQDEYALGRIQNDVTTTTTTSTA